jgi:hypothetical protein
MKRSAKKKSASTRTKWIVAASGLLVIVLMAVLVSTTQAAGAKAAQVSWRSVTTTAATSSPGSTLSSGSILYEETNQKLVFAGTWKANNTTAHSGGSAKYAYKSGASLTVYFDGTSLDLIGMTSRSSGKARVTLDGDAGVLVDLYTARTAYQATLYSTGELADGQHSVKIEWTGLKNSLARDTKVYVDAVEVDGSLVATGATVVVVVDAVSEAATSDPSTSTAST